MSSLLFLTTVMAVQLPMVLHLFKSPDTLHSYLRSLDRSTAIALCQTACLRAKVHTIPSGLVKAAPYILSRIFVERLISLVGLVLMLTIAFALSSNRKKINWRTVISGVSLQIFLGLIILKTDAGQNFFQGAKDVFTAILSYTNAGSQFIFGSLMDGKKHGFIFFTIFHSHSGRWIVVNYFCLCYHS